MPRLNVAYVAYSKLGEAVYILLPSLTARLCVPNYDPAMPDLSITNNIERAR
jgi:hypothetical protein